MREAMTSATRAEDFECTVCLRLLAQPATTPCGHSFCRPCLTDALRHRAGCPLCRAPLHADPARLAISTELARLLEAVFPDEYAARLDEQRVEEAARAAQRDAGQGQSNGDEAELPCFVLGAVLPRQRLALHVFEPRYRLMTERCLAGSRRFGMVPADLRTVGTEVEIVECQPLPGGRFYLEVVGRRVFHVQGAWVLDGYMNARVQFVPPDVSVAPNVLVSTAQLCASLELLLDQWQHLTREASQQAEQADLMRDLGEQPPSDCPGDLALWAAALINPQRPFPRLARDIRVAVLAERDAHARLALVSAAMRDAMVALQLPLGRVRLFSTFTVARNVFAHIFRYGWIVALGWCARQLLTGGSTRLADGSSAGPTVDPTSGSTP
mmetsp:Transcript_16980/g.53916  ORF Transcript_16980/g.53916 Transcript_16980/m.53916 type:complete len:382 (-) Transcript_16980:510-1655(-)